MGIKTLFCYEINLSDWPHSRCVSAQIAHDVRWNCLHTRDKAEGLDGKGLVDGTYSFCLTAVRWDNSWSDTARVRGCCAAYSIRCPLVAKECVLPGECFRQAILTSLKRCRIPHRLHLCSLEVSRSEWPATKGEQKHIASYGRRYGSTQGYGVGQKNLGRSSRTAPNLTNKNMLTKKKLSNWMKNWIQN